MKTQSFEWISYRRAAIAVLSLAVLSGCANITFKRGASPDAMGADESACRAANSAEAAYAECMRSRGWFVRDARTTPAPTVTVIPAAKPAAPAAAVEPARTVPTPAEVPAVAPAAAVATPVTAAPSPAAPPAVPAETIEEPAAAAEEPAPEDPLTRINMGSWWKLGGSNADLDRSIAACVAKLGPAHQPDPGAMVVTAALRDCLRAAGWHGVTAVP